MQEAFFDEAVDAAGAMMRGAAAEVLVLLVLLVLIRGFFRGYPSASRTPCTRRGR